MTAPFLPRTALPLGRLSRGRPTGGPVRLVARGRLIEQGERPHVAGHGVGVAGSPRVAVLLLGGLSRGGPAGGFVRLLSCGRLIEQAPGPHPAGRWGRLCRGGGGWRSSSGMTRPWETSRRVRPFTLLREADRAGARAHLAGQGGGLAARVEVGGLVGQPLDASGRQGQQNQSCDEPPAPAGGLEALRGAAETSGRAPRHERHAAAAPGRCATGGRAAGDERQSAAAPTPARERGTNAAAGLRSASTGRWGRNADRARRVG
jgi:hypothetical protein